VITGQIRVALTTHSCYARDYLKLIAKGNSSLEKAAESYAKVASCLRPVWEFFSSTRPVEERLLSKLSDDIRAEN